MTCRSVRSAGILGFVLAVGLLGLAAPGAQAQLNFGIHAARAAKAFGGANGLGASLELSVPVLPVDVMVAGDWFRPDCGTASGCSFLGAGADVHFAMPFPVLQPYGLAGVVVRRSKQADGFDTRSDRGLALGVGVNLRSLVVGAYGEARYEFVDPKREFVFRLGLRF